MTGRRRQAREAALRILYLWEVGRIEPEEAIAVFFREHAPGHLDGRTLGLERLGRRGAVLGHHGRDRRGALKVRRVGRHTQTSERLQVRVTFGGLFLFV